jgi:hypothetical protein
MKHNFPSDKYVVCSEVITLEQAKEILKLAIDYDVPVFSDTFSNKVSNKFPYYGFSGHIVQYSSVDDSNIIVSFEDFKKFIMGVGILPPEPKSLRLNDEYKATILNNGDVNVGCQVFTSEVICELYKLSYDTKLGLNDAPGVIKSEFDTFEENHFMGYLNGLRKDNLVRAHGLIWLLLGTKEQNSVLEHLNSVKALKKF